MSPEELAALRQNRYNATVVHLHKLHSDLMVLRVKPDFPRPTYKAGQYCSLGLGYWEPRVEGCQAEELKPEDQSKLVRRAYSVSSSIYTSPGVLRDMTQDDWVEFYIVLVRENLDGRVPALTPRLFALREGDRLNMFEKFTGHYTLDCVKETDNVVFLGSGTGEAPHNAMTWELLTKGHKGKILNACCVRYTKDLGYLETHRQLEKQYPQYAYMALTTRDPGVTKKSYIQDVILNGELEARLGATLDPANTHVFLCGNPKMIGVPQKDKETGQRVFPKPTGVIEILENRRFTVDNSTAKVKGNIHFEEYW